MKIDKSLKEFSEKWNKDAIDSIEAMSQDISLNMSKFKGLDIQESFDKFSEFMNGYSEYKLANVIQEGANKVGSNGVHSNDDIIKRADSFVSTNLFKDKNIYYKECSDFVASYISGVQSLLGTVDRIKMDLTENCVDNESIGHVNTLADIFMEKLDESFEPIMNKLLWASGYNSKQILFNKAKKEKTYFL